jgi:NitT/TauT family transport system ATP-binding protein
VSNIVFDKVARHFRRDGKDIPAIDEVSFEVRAKEFVAIVGPSGCGKTTCLRMAAGLEFPTAGSVTVGGKPVTGPGPDRSVVFQQFALFPWKTAVENIEFGLRATSVALDDRRSRVARYIELMGLQGYESAFPHQLSGGMQQRVAIARSYVLDPDVLLMDEPFGSLDALTREHLQVFLAEICAQKQLTTLFVTHSIDEAIFLSDRIIVMGVPGRAIGEFRVDLPRPRNEIDWRATPEFTQMRADIWNLLEADVPTHDAIVAA